MRQQVVSYQPDYPVARAYATSQPAKGSGLLGNLICLLFVVVAAGAAIGIAVTQLNKDDLNGKSNKSNRLEGLVIPNCTVQTPLDFGNTYINLIFATCPDDASYQAFVKAAFQWSSVITNNPFEDNGPTIGLSGFDAQDCGIDNSIPFAPGFEFNHLIIAAEAVFIDDVGNVLGQAGPCLLSSTGGFPILGIMQFDSADLADMNADGILEDVILHEMGHVLGVGTLWDSEGLLQDAVFTRNNNGQIISSVPANKPKFIGAQGVAELKKLSGDNTETFIPVEDGKAGDGTPFFNTAAPAFQGGGSVDGHWKISDFGTELMVFAIDSNVDVHALSKMTIASLKDFGYTVDVDLGDDFTLPSGSSLRGASTGVLGSGFDIKNNVASESGIYVLDGDVNKEWPIFVLDAGVARSLSAEPLQTVEQNKFEVEAVEKN